MSGSSPGDPPDDSGDSADRPRSRQDRNATNGRNPSGESPTTTEHNPSAGPERDRVTIEDDGVVRWFLKSEDGNVIFFRDILSSVAIVAVIGLLLFAVSGIWPPLVAVESGSMEPNMHRGDLIFVTDSDRFVGDEPVEGTGVVTLENGQESGHEKFGNPGDVIVFRPGGSERETPVIHRAHFWVEEGENWVDTKADEEVVGDATCEDVATCPAEYDGFVTKGDANAGYDQYQGGARTDIVKPEWITGKAMFRVPWLGHVRLTFDTLFGGMLAPTPVFDGVPGASPAPGPSIAQAGLVGATGLAGTSASVVVAIGRRRT